MKQMIHSLILFSCFFASVLSTSGASGSPLVRKTDRENQREYCEAYLKSYDNADLSVDSTSVFYNSSIPVASLSRIDNLSENEAEEEGEVTFDVTYMALLNKIFITASLIDDLGNTLDSVFVSGDAFLSSTTNQPEIRYDYAGVNFLASEYVNPSLIEPVFFVNDGDINIGINGRSIEYPVITITLSVANLDEALEATEGIYDYPTLLEDGPIEYMIYQAKLYLIASNYSVNASKTNPLTMVLNQSNLSWEQWKYGFSNMKEAGCEIFAMFNFFISQGKTPHLATLIAVTQLLNADMGFGLLGTNPWPEELVTALSVFTLAALEILSPIIITVVMPVVATYMVASYTSSLNWWNQLILWPVYPINVGITIVALDAIFIAALSAGNIIYDYHVKYFHSMNDVLSFFGGVTNIQTKITYDSFKILSGDYGCYIISFWWELVDVFGVTVPNPLGKFHTIFVNKSNKTSTDYIGYNLNGDGVEWTFASLAGFIDSNETNAKLKFICGFALGA